MYNIDQIRADFPIFKRIENGKPIVYLDSAASAQKPQCVLDKMTDVYQNSYANVHRSEYLLADEITTLYENARERIQNFISASSSHEIIFTRNATESINLVANTWGLENLQKDDVILVSEAEHHANLTPWQIVAQKTGAKLKVFKISDTGNFLQEEFEKSLKDNVKLVAVTAMSNVLGTIFPIRQIIQKAHQVGAKVLVDACQGVVHQKTDVQDLDCDFLAFSGHKLYGPTGIGVLYIKSEISKDMPPYQTGGDMVDTVTYEKTTYALPPARFEAGTPAIVEAIGLGEAVSYLSKIGMENISSYEKELLTYFNQKANELPHFKIIGTAKNKGGVISFDYKGIHPQDLSFILSHENVAIRVGHHCAEPLVHRMGYSSIARASFGMYTLKEDIDLFFKALLKADRFF